MRLVAALAFILTLCGCTGATTRDFCVLFQPVYLDKKDILTPQTEDQIYVNNELYSERCQ